MDDKKRSASRSPSPRRSRTHDDIPDSRSHSKSRKYRDHKEVQRIKAYSRSRSHSPIPRKRSYKSSKYESRKGSRSRSRSPYRARVSRSRSRSYSKYSRERSFSPHVNHKRGKSRSPHSNRKRHIGSRDDPRPNRCLGVFGLSVCTTEHQIYSIFNKFGPVDRVVIVIDAKTKRPKGYCFVYFSSIEDARAAKEQCSGMEIDGRMIRVDYSITERAHTPTPGFYMGKVTHFHDNRRDDWGGPRRRDNYRNYRRSPSPYYKSRRPRYERSRSRSYSPRRY